MKTCASACRLESVLQIVATQQKRLALAERIPIIQTMLQRSMKEIPLPPR
jgi:Trp operon repressor